MSVLSTAAQKQVEDSLVSDKLLTREQLAQLKVQAEQEHAPFLSKLVSSGHITDEALTRTIAHINKVPYVNLSSAKIDAEVLDLLPQEVAERYMAVPLGEMQNRLVVAMLDADNVQPVDFLSNKIGRPLKVYAASEAGIRQVLHQYQNSISEKGGGERGNFGGAAVDLSPETVSAIGSSGDKNIKTIVQDSPISKALSTIL